MTISILNPNFQKETFQKFTAEYSEYLDEVFAEFDESYAKKFFSKEFRTEISKLNQEKHLFHYSPLSFYFAKQIENALFLAHLHSEIDEDPEVEVEVFDFWKDSDFGELFLERNQKDEGQNISKLSLSFKPLLENQILSFYYLHLSQRPEAQPDILDYYIQTSLGDSTDRVYLTDLHYSVTKTALFAEGLLEVNCLTSQRSSLEVQTDGDIKAFIVDKEVKSIQLEDGKELYLNPPAELDERLDQFKSDCIKALQNIKKISPSLYECFFTFTHTIVPVDEKGIVSFSSQNLPGYSSLNIVGRNYIELHDDLLHENGHHYLNSILNTTELIEEDDEQIFYSPWRKSRRPIRGIYHAYFTFYWAFQLFHDLTKALASGVELQGLNKENLSFCATRATEEFLMLNYVHDDLLIARDMGKVTDDGFKFINLVNEMISSQKEGVENFKEYIVAEDLKVIDELKSELKKQKQENPY